MTSPGSYPGPSTTSTGYPTQSGNGHGASIEHVAEAPGPTLARGPALCWEVWRAFKRLFDGEDVPAWADLDEGTRRRYLDLYWRPTAPDAVPGRGAADTAREPMQHALLDGVVRAVDELDHWTETLGGEG